MIAYIPELGFKWDGADTDNKLIAPLVKLWGDSAMYYLCYFSHPNSPYLFASNDKDRDELVIGELRANKWAKKSSNGAMNYPLALYTAPGYSEAAESLLKIKAIPDFMEIVTIDRQIEEAIRDNDKLKSSANADEAIKTIKAKKELQQLLSTLYKQKAEATERWRKGCQHSGIITPDEIWTGL